MDRKFLSEGSREFSVIHGEWIKKAKSISSIEEFNDFFNHLMNDYSFDYGTMCYVVGELAVAAASLGAHTLGITGFQAGCAMWEFIETWNFPYNKTGLKLFDFDEMLYPQYEYKFDKTISSGVWRRLQAEAAKKLKEDNGFAHPDVVKHWERIANGEVPFGYKIKDDH